ncbi:MAG: FAD-dependent oxidoreductase [Candidatus Nezhaarchaeales archaeon]
MIEVDVVILGCDWAGILAAYRLAKHNITVLCLEKERKPGGLLRTEHYRDFVIDTGGSHVIFSKDEQVLSALLGLLGENVVRNVRSSFINLKGRLVPYPIETGLYVLPPEDRFETVKSFLEAMLSRYRDFEPKSLLEWIYSMYGSWIARNYLEPYNKKIWKRPLDQISLEWVSIPGRLPLPDWKEVVKAAVGLPSTGYIEQAVFYYPAKGGIEALFNSVYEKALALGVRVLTNFQCLSLRANDNGIIVNNTIKARKYLINTIPLPDLVKVIDEYDYATTYLKHFDYNKVVVIAVGVNRPAPSCHWIYVPDERIVFHRYAWVSNYSPNNAPPNHSLALLEITIKKDEDVAKSLVASALRDFLELTDLKEDNIVFVKPYLNEYGYPIHNLKIKEARDAILGWLKKKNILSIGRWGSWFYYNMDQVYRNVQDVVDDLVKG